MVIFHCYVSSPEGTKMIVSLPDGKAQIISPALSIEMEKSSNWMVDFPVRHGLSMTAVKVRLRMIIELRLHHRKGGHPPTYKTSGKKPPFVDHVPFFRFPHIYGAFPTSFVATLKTRKWPAFVSSHPRGNLSKWTKKCPRAFGLLW